MNPPEYLPETIQAAPFLLDETWILIRRFLSLLNNANALEAAYAAVTEFVEAGHKNPVYLLDGSRAMTTGSTAHLYEIGFRMLEIYYIQTNSLNIAYLCPKEFCPLYIAWLFHLSVFDLILKQNKITPGIALPFTQRTFRFFRRLRLKGTLPVIVAPLMASYFLNRAIENKSNKNRRLHQTNTGTQKALSSLLSTKRLFNADAFQIEMVDKGSADATVLRDIHWFIFKTGGFGFFNGMGLGYREAVFFIWKAFHEKALVARDSNNQIVGVLLLGKPQKNDWNNEATINPLLLLTATSQQKKGIGTLLCNKMFEWAATQSPMNVQIESTFAAVSFYKSLGERLGLRGESSITFNPALGDGEHEFSILFTNGELARWCKNNQSH
jgi:GNAT superfamily N-acetyltransferase